MTPTDPSPADVVGKLRALCVGHPYAKVAWPHRELHEAADLITALEARAEKAERERDDLAAMIRELHRLRPLGTTLQFWSLERANKETENV